MNTLYFTNKVTKDSTINKVFVAICTSSLVFSL
jgi:hypothetical protein